MFKQLSQLLTAKTDTFSMTVALDDPTPAEALRLRVTVLPKLSGGDKKLNRPLVLTGTPEELDSPEFMNALQEHAASVTDLRAAIAEETAANKAEAASTRTKKPAPKATAKPAAKPATKPATPIKAGKNPMLARAKNAAPVEPPSPPRSGRGAGGEVSSPEQATPAAPEPPKNAAEATASLI